MRQRLVVSGRLTIAAVTVAASLLAALAAAPVGGRPARHVILFVGDGMQLEHEIAASRFLTGLDRGLSFQRLPYESAVATWDVTTYDRYALDAGAALYDPEAIDPRIGYDPERGGARPYPKQRRGIDDLYFLTALPGPDGSWGYPATDSASAATAVATGFKTDDGNISWLPGDPPDGALVTLAEWLRAERGMAIGVVSTVPFTHATPAAHVSHSPSRHDYYAIGDEIARVVRPEVVISGGHPLWDGFAYLSPELYADLAAGRVPGYVFVERVEGVDGGAAVRAAAAEAVERGLGLFGLFGGPGGNFESPVPQDDGSATVLRATIENPLLRDATVAALDVLSRDPDGFFLMVEQGDIDWANHANDYRRMVGTVWDLDGAVRAAVSFVNRPGDGIDWGDTLLLVTADHGNGYMRLTEGVRLGKGELPVQYGATYPGGEVTYATGSHTNELVSLYARGSWRSLAILRGFEGTWYPCTRILDNTQIHHAIARAAGAPRPSALEIGVSAPEACEPDRWAHGRAVARGERDGSR